MKQKRLNKGRDSMKNIFITTRAMVLFSQGGILEWTGMIKFYHRRLFTKRGRLRGCVEITRKHTKRWQNFPGFCETYCQTVAAVLTKQDIAECLKALWWKSFSSGQNSVSQQDSDLAHQFHSTVGWFTAGNIDFVLLC